MTAQAITAWVCVAAVVALIGFDVWAYANGIPGDTISEVTRSAARRYPILPFAAGVVVGHFFW